MDQGDFHLEKAPIVEAIIAIDIAPPLSDDLLAAIEAASTAIHEDYPESEPMKQMTFQLEIGPGVPTLPQQPAQQDFGRKCVSSDKRQLVVFQPTGFSLD